MEQEKRNSEAAIRELLDRYVKAVRTKDITGVMAVYSPDVVAFDVVPPLQYVGAEAFEAPWRDVFERYQGPIDYEIHSLSIVAGDDIAFSHSLNRTKGTLTNGQKTDLWLRWTAGYRKINSSWRIAHLQISVPVDLRTRTAMLDLKP